MNSAMLVVFGDFLDHMQWTWTILVPNRSSLDLHFGIILHVIFGRLCGVLAYFSTRGFTMLVHNTHEL